jgi:hypothetical protein
VDNLAELAGFGMGLAFLWFCWPPLVLLGGCVLLVVWANTRTHHGRLGTALGAAVTAARKAYAASRDEQQQQTQQLRPVA